MTKNFFKGCFKSFDFKGRTSKGQYRDFALGYVLFFVLLVLFDSEFNVGDTFGRRPLIISFFIISALPCVSISVRRFHDMGVSGWCLINGMAPFKNATSTLNLLMTDGERKANKWGTVPPEF